VGVFEKPVSFGLQFSTERSYLQNGVKGRVE